MFNTGFYCAYCRKQYLDKSENIWKDTNYQYQNIVVIAENLEEAENKVSELIARLNDGENERYLRDNPKYPFIDRYRWVLITDTCECIGLVEFSDSLIPISK